MVPNHLLLEVVQSLDFGDLLNLTILSSSVLCIYVAFLLSFQLSMSDSDTTGGFALPDKVDACRCVMFQNLAKLMSPSINRVVEFAKRIPGNQLTDISEIIFPRFCF